ncbi:SDR family NAD(P)-dependent oxidoreductase [Dactylosporangium vinaceum]|uniref:SDR family NAD(P)-dependent oxidoreductase n=1 Tax=Dactylosporangium vinaceum TaxID=53362 RepID=A0ABV5MK30_9ACTN|nr:SDR family NAD(P)-dependent oxidoreductase [Dactylosporangium vinaceum]UAB93617.1 SDR family NAD(P)-dependent oxidoreductase [Dactylosporangium vinaceum]
MWSIDDIGDLTGRVALVTGARGGIGREVATVLRGRGATVLTPGRAELDLGSLASVRAFAAAFAPDRLDLLVNNAGLMIPPFGLTADGFETQIGVNHLGHFALTGLLLDRLLATPGSRVVTVSSNAHKRGVVDLDDLHFARRRYVPMTGYAQSKLANLLFAAALQRRLSAAGAPVLSVAAHPGAARTGLMRTSPAVFRFVVSRRTKWLFSWLIQDPLPAALPILRAAFEPSPAPYYGPDGWGEFTGRPVAAPTAPVVSDTGLQERLWAASERLTGVTYALPAGAAGAVSPG